MTRFMVFAAARGVHSSGAIQQRTYSLAMQGVFRNVMVIFCMSLSGCAKENATTIGDNRHSVTISFPMWTTPDSIRENLRESAQRICPGYTVSSESITPAKFGLGGGARPQQISAIIDCPGRIATYEAAKPTVQLAETRDISTAPSRNKGNDVKDPLVTRKISEWTARNTWFSPSGLDQASLITIELDRQIAHDGFDPRTDLYWNELDRRILQWARQTQAEANNRASQIQNQIDSEAEAQRRLLLLRFSAGMMAPTRAGGFGEAIGNGFSGVTGQVPSYSPPPVIYVPPTQTICQRFSQQVICNTQ